MSQIKFVLRIWAITLLMPWGTVEASTAPARRHYGESDIPYLACVVLGEGASEGVEGMALIISTMQNRNWRWNRYAYSAANRPGLLAWCQSQPRQIILSSTRLVTAHLRGTPAITTADHYVTQTLFESPRCPRWAKTMRIVQVYKKHVFLKAR